MGLSLEAQKGWDIPPVIRVNIFGGEEVGNERKN